MSRAHPQSCNKRRHPQMRDIVSADREAEDIDIDSIRLTDEVVDRNGDVNDANGSPVNLPVQVDSIRPRMR